VLESSRPGLGIEASEAKFYGLGLESCIDNFWRHPETQSTTTTANRIVKS